ncbi:hypothetical protein DMB38_20560 [Streptomyces sp. WAC 06738]|uniref:hypothetical protein n=1 Tax=Streptomyces sp. WAC 06738 TaxID=2203210 RepID=UPI000F6F8C21|nr:hypothetical protein [Streptomyces sp. WAC 06738]AZM47863.1 hypothetical protein DMB38_20560 [Streptomyces sp. WAC 06738]
MVMLKCPGSCNSKVIEANEGEKPGEDGYATRKCAGCQWHDDGIGGPDDCGCSDCERAMAAEHRANWRKHQKLELADEQTSESDQFVCQVKIWRLTDTSAYTPKVFTIVDSTPLQYDRCSWTGVPSCTVYRGGDMVDCLTTVPSLDRARLFIARSCMTGYDSFEALDTETGNEWLEIIAELIAAELLKGEKSSEEERVRTFYAGNPWHPGDGDDFQLLTRRDFAGSVFSVVEHMAVDQGTEPLAVAVKAWHDGFPEPTYTDLHPAA